MTVERDVIKKVDNFDYVMTLADGTEENGWMFDKTTGSGTPTALTATEDGGSLALTIANDSEAQALTLTTNDILVYDLAKLQHVWFIAKASGIDAVTEIVFGVGSAKDATLDDVATNCWFRVQGSASTSAVVVESDPPADDSADDTATGKTLDGTYRKYLIDFTNGLADVRFYIDGDRVASGTTFNMSGVTSGTNVQPYISVGKASGTGTPALTIAQFGVQYETAYGA